MTTGAMIGLGRLNRTLKAWSTQGRFTHASVTSRPSADRLDSRPGMLSPLAVLDWLPAGSDDGELATLGSVAFQHLASRAQGGDVWIPPLVNQVELALAAPFAVRPVIVGG
jgi:hypothetical protein